MKARNYIILLFVTALFAACNTPKNFNYLQDLTNGQEIITAVDGTIRLHPTASGRPRDSNPPSAAPSPPTPKASPATPSTAKAISTSPSSEKSA